jgi:protease-4
MRRLLKWLVRTIVVFVVLFLIAIVSQYASHRYRPGSVIEVDLDGPIVERGTLTPLGVLNSHQAAMNQIRQALRTAENDQRISGLALKVIDPEMELAQAQELADMIAEFRSHGKWTTAYMETAGESGYGNLPYMVASAADEVSMMPQGEMNLLGVSMREIFARGTLDWLKIKPNFDAIGKYKSAGNIFTQKNFTASQREEDEALSADMFNQIVDATAHHRHLSRDAVRAAIDHAPLSAEEGVKAHLLDRIEYEDQFEDRVKHYRGETHELIASGSYARPQPLAALHSHQRIAIIYGVGAIQRGSGGFDPVLSPGSNAMGSDDMVEAFKNARDDSSVRAVVFRIDSPGGSVIASELIRRAVELCAHKKPIVVSMSGYAASGGYWVATPAARILADPGTLTGSIGVLGGKFNIAGAANALGINSGAISRGANADMFDSFTDFTPQQAQIFHDQLLGDTYKYFIKIVAERRNLSVNQVDNIAQGRVWSGAQALNIKLVDRIGGMDLALAEAKRLAKLDPQTKVEVEELPTPPNIFTRLLGAQAYAASATQWSPPRALIPLMWMLREALAHHGSISAVYCPLVPVM